MRRLFCKKLNFRILKIDNRCVSTIIGSMLLVSLVTSSMSVLISATSECSRQALLKENDTKQDHLELIQDMQEFYNLVNETNTSFIDNVSIKPAWYWPDNESTDIPLRPVCKVFIDGSKSSVATVLFRYYGIDNNYLIESSGLDYKTVDGKTLVTMRYDEAVSPNTTYYWKIVIISPGEIFPQELTLSFTTGSP